jgi:hypothetical protein
MEEISLTEFIKSLGESYQKIFDLLGDDTFVSLAKEVAPMMKVKINFWQWKHYSRGLNTWKII